MDRRALLVSLGSLLLHPLGGCGQRLDDSSDQPIPFEARYSKDLYAEPILAGGLGDGTDENPYYATLVTDRRGLDRFNFEYMAKQEGIDAEVLTFVRGTDFDRAFLLVVQSLLRSGSSDLELEGVRRSRDGEVHADVTSPATTGGTTEVVRATIYGRLFDAGATAPDGVTVTYTGNPYDGGGTTVFTTA